MSVAATQPAETHDPQDKLGARSTTDGGEGERCEGWSPGAGGGGVDRRDRARLTGRPAGTEPKIKFYFERVARVTASKEIAAARTTLEARGTRAKAEVSSRLGLG